MESIDSLFTLHNYPKPSICEYTNLLHKHGVGSIEARKYRELFKEQEEFQSQCVVMDGVFEAKEQAAQIHNS